MERVYVTGHRNPDLDTISSAWCYAQLKNRVDPEKTYIPVRLGPLNETTRDLFHNLGVEPPEIIKDVRAKVEDVVITDFWSLHPDDPVYFLVKMISDRRSSVVPLLDNKTYKGLLSLDEITAFFLKENAGKRPQYRFYPDNFDKVISGELIKKGQQKSFEAYIMTGAMEFDVYCSMLDSLTPNLPVLVVGNRRKHIKYAIEKQFPAIILTGIEKSEKLEIDFSSYQGTIYKSYLDTAETIRLLRMSLPVHLLLQKEPPQIQSSDLFDDAKRVLSSSEYRGLPVFNEKEFVGYVTRRCFLEKPKHQVIMVDHNEINQSVDGVEEAEIIEIIDHHRLDAKKTPQPIFIASEPVGSTCTIIYHQFLRWSVPVDKTTAYLLLAGIIADTIILKSPTTTAQDSSAAHTLKKIAKVEDLTQFGENLFAIASPLSKRDPQQVVESDFKIYSEKRIRFGIGQVEVTTLEQVEEVKERYLEQLEIAKQKYALQWALLLVTDVIKEESLLFSTAASQYEKSLIYPKRGVGLYFLKGVLSRKKQLLPEIVRVIEEES